MKRITALVLASLPFLTLAQSPPVNDFADMAAKQGLPIQNLGVLKAYAMGQVTQGTLSVYSSSILGQSPVITVTSQSPEGTSGVLNILGQQRITFAFANPEDAVYLNLFLTDKDGFQLFGDSKQSGFEKLPGGTFWVRSRDNFLIAKLGSVLPITILGIESARVAVRNEAGQVIEDRFLNVHSDRLFYPTNLVERKGEVYLTFRETDGRLTSKVFGLDGAALTTFQSGGYIAVGLDGYFDFGANPRNVSLYGVNIRSAVIHFEVKIMPDFAGTLTLGGQSVSGERPVGFLIPVNNEMHHSTRFDTIQAAPFWEPLVC